MLYLSKGSSDKKHENDDAGTKSTFYNKKIKKKNRQQNFKN
jgi:hypothetical protein